MNLQIRYLFAFDVILNQNTSSFWDLAVVFHIYTNHISEEGAAV